uniref:Uncharacterized protein n=1 Tax=Rhizophora mucronata TaxID=61149 RepID=A0A2P2PUH3_RHIMU
MLQNATKTKLAYLSPHNPGS